MKKYSLLFEDDDLILVDKPQGLATTPGRIDDLVTAVFGDFPRLARVRGFKEGEGGLLNRLDNETGGIVFFARSDDGFTYYADLMKRGGVIKTYTALVDGVPREKAGIITHKIAHHKKNKAKMVIVPPHKHRGKPQEAETRWKLLKKHDTKSLLEVSITRGVRHQIRVHLASIGLPIAADKLYNKEAYPEHMCQRLYATKVCFFNRLANREISVETKASF